jgi:hypothetical protein
LLASSGICRNPIRHMGLANVVIATFAKPNAHIGLRQIQPANFLLAWSPTAKGGGPPGHGDGFGQDGQAASRGRGTGYRRTNRRTPANASREKRVTGWPWSPSSTWDRCPLPGICQPMPASRTRVKSRRRAGDLSACPTGQ